MSTRRRRRCVSTSTPSSSIATPSCSSGWATSTRCSTKTRCVAARALELTLTSRSKDANGGGIPMCGVPVPRRRRLHRAARQAGLPRRDLRPGRGSAEGQGLVKREVVRVVSPGTLTDAELSRRARAGVPDGRRPAAEPRGHRPSASRCSTSPRASSRAAEYAGDDGLQALADELAVLGRAKSRAGTAAADPHGRRTRPPLARPAAASTVR